MTKRGVDGGKGVNGQRLKDKILDWLKFLLETAKKKYDPSWNKCKVGCDIIVGLSSYSKHSYIFLAKTNGKIKQTKLTDIDHLKYNAIKKRCPLPSQVLSLDKLYPSLHVQIALPTVFSQIPFRQKSVFSHSSTSKWREEETRYKAP